MKCLRHFPLRIVFFTFFSLHPSYKDAPKIQPIANLNVNQGTDATFQCVVDGEPAPITVQWYFNNTGPLVNSADYVISEVTTTNTYNTGVTSDLKVNNVQRLSDVGLYTCKASNVIGQNEESGNLTVACMEIIFFLIFTCL